ncbi:murein biosynthesis integral membrane protein MurJ [Roseateles saccharophilus]|uniref:Probable lipid II flippase MurJ n=1 Tax=Roseateles saccharophilus TaxID=304 RepID=A0A4R3V9Y9_ROSSA|nr:murein biosynthesis integral membrane protein MurJ [Roseateles saccharophilus]MDG0832627.1 murein biosynthesis integral membrane protein MurJ [Roseateles saccharophilus]TCV00364.1 putative peptidoglycan lipid II flippase [Roseateles saccharophilus]
MNLLRAASTISLLTLTSRITGLVREQMMAGLFGANAMTDAFLVAFRIPNLLRRLFAEGAFSQAFVPLLAATRATEGDEATHRLVDAVATVLLWVLIGTSVLGIVAAPLLVWLLGSGLSAKAFDASVVMTRFMFPYIGCMSLVALSAGILNTWRRFAVPAASPVLLNLSMIACGWALVGPLQRAGWPGIYGMAAGVMLGGLLQLAVQWPALSRIGMRPRMRWTLGGLRDSRAHPGVGRMLLAMGPALLGVGVSQLSLMINTQISSHLAEGATSWLNYADRLMEFPIGLLGVALSAVLTPQLSAAQASGEDARYSHLLDWGLRMVLLLALPCAVALLVFAEPLTAVLYHRKAFGAADVAHTAQSVMGWGVGLLGLIAVKVLAPGFYARQDTGTPAKIAVVVLVLTQCFNLVFVPWIGVAGLALSIGLGALVNASWLLLGLRKLGSYRPEPGWLAFGLRVGAGCVAMGLLQWQLASRLDWIALGAHEFHRALVMAASLAGSAVVYFSVLMLAGVKLKALSRPA